MLILIGLEAMRLLAFHRRRGIASVVRWNLRPVRIGVEFVLCQAKRKRHLNQRKSLGHRPDVPGTPGLSGPLDRLNARLSLLQPLDRYRARSAIGSAIGRPLSRIPAQVGVLNRLVLNRLGGSTVR